jgi:hypothetical protein
VTQIASIYIQQGSVNIIEIEDIRPIIGFKAGGVNASSVHGNLLGLNADDHTQYLLVDGGRAMEGDLDMGGNDIFNVDRFNSNEVTSTSVSATTYYNLPVDPSYVSIVFGHSTLNPVDATTYYIGELSTLTPSTTNRDAWSLVSQYTGVITEVSILSNFVGGSNENSTFTLYNISGGTSQTISSTLQFTSGSSTTLLSETFLGTTQPAGWTSSLVTYANSYAGLTGTTSTLTSPVFDGSLYTSLIVSLDIATFGAGTDGPILVEYSLDNGSTFSTAGLTATPTAASPYIPTSVTVPTTSSQMKIRFSINPTGTKGKRIRNVVIAAVSFSPTLNNNFVLGTPLSVTSGDKLQVRWSTPTWVTNPTTVTTLINLKMKL